MRRYTTTVGVHGRSVRVEERSSKSVRFRWWNAVTRAHESRSVPMQLRDQAGRLLPHAVAQTVAFAAELLGSVGAALHDAAESQEPQAGQRSGPATPSRHDPRVVTLEQAFGDLLSLEGGKWHRPCTAHAEANSKAVDVVTALGARIAIDSIVTNSYCGLWRSLARRYSTGETRTIHVGRPRSADSTTPTTRAKREVRWGGRRHAEQCVQLLRSCLVWAVRAGKLKQIPDLPTGWMAELASDWEQITGVADEQADDVGPAYSLEEAAAIYRAAPDGDPRIWLAIELAIELRLGQVIRIMRSDLDLERGDHGALVVRGRGKKLGTTIFLDQQMRAVIDRLMSRGYLQPLEAAFRDKRIKDYPLIPGGKIGYGLDPARRHKPLTRSGAGGMFLRVEAAAKVKHLRGRLWYGFRRFAADRAEELAANDPRVQASVQGLASDDTKGPNDDALNSLTGHKHTRSRRRYQQRNGERVLKQAARIRRGIRDDLLNVPQNPLDRTDLSKEKP